MPSSKKATKQQKTSSRKPSTSLQIDIIFSGPLLFIPEIHEGNIGGLEVYCPHNGHPVGAVFLPGVFFTDADLDAVEGDNWPESQSFSLLDPHSYLLRLTQTEPQASLPVTSIPDTNHKVRGGRKLGGGWHIAFKLFGQISRWSSHRLYPIADGMYYGSDRPTGSTVTSLQRLSYSNVTNAEAFGLSPEQTEYVRANWKSGGTFIVEGETPYQSSLWHERDAIDALAKLAGLNLHLTISAPIAGRARLQGKIIACTNSVIAI